MSPAKRPLLFVATTPFAVNAFLRTHLHALAERHEVTLCVNTGAYPLEEDIRSKVRVVHVDIVRKISLWADLRALAQLARRFRSLHPVAVHSITPKAGLLAMLAGLAVRVPLRLHTFTGQVWANKAGVNRWLLKSLDWLIAACATRVFADSASQCRLLEAEGVVPAGGISVLGPGSIAGVDPARFRPDPAVRQTTRVEVGTAGDAFVILFVGRLVRDKGVVDLVEAFGALAAAHPDWELWMAGPDEEGLQADLRRRGEQLGCRIRWWGPTSSPERLMAAADLFALPSYREGFGSVIIEAAACGLPAVAYRVDGVVDAIIDGETGRLLPAGDVPALAAALSDLLSDAAKRLELGRKAQARAVADYSSAAVTAAWLDFYDSALAVRLQLPPGPGPMF